MFKNIPRQCKMLSGIFLRTSFSNTSLRLVLDIARCILWVSFHILIYWWWRQSFWVSHNSYEDALFTDQVVFLECIRHHPTEEGADRAKKRDHTLHGRSHLQVDSVDEYFGDSCHLTMERILLSSVSTRVLASCSPEIVDMGNSLFLIAALTRFQHKQERFYCASTF